MANYWIKLYIDILDDPKMGTLPDNLWRRAIELFLLAGRLYDDGVLPGTEEIAWAMRQDKNILETELNQLVKTGIVSKTDTGWFIPKFKTRQEPMSPAERMQRSRETKQHKQYNGNVTKPLQNVTQITDTDTDNRLDTDAEFPQPELFTMYQNEIGNITPMIADTLDNFEKEYPRDWFAPAFKEAVNNNARNVKYIEAILKRWKIEGFQSRNKPEKKQEMSQYDKNKLVAEELIREMQNVEL